MMPYAAEGKISKRKIEGGIEISDKEYREALQAQIEGRRVVVRNDKLRILSRETRTVYSTKNKSRREIPENDDTPDSYTEQEPGRFDKWDSEKEEWIKDEEAEAHARIRKIDDDLRALDQRYGDRALREDLLDRGAFKSDKARQRVQRAEDRAADLRKERSDLVNKYGQPEE